MEHLVNFKNYNKKKFETIIECAIKIKNNPDKYKNSLQGKKMYMLFEKTSTRTALSFALAMQELGGTYFLQNWCDSNFIIGEICDEIRYVGRNVDVIMVRLKDNEMLKEMETNSTVPLINGCCNKYHPSQALADLLTIKEIFGDYNIKLLYVGVKNNIFNSISESLPILGGTLYCMTPIINEASENYEQDKTKEINYFELNPNMQYDEFKELAREVDIIYTDSWIDMEFFNDDKYINLKNERISKMMPFQINSNLLEDSKAIVLHDMPMHAGYEITRDVIENNMKYILHQAENRRHVEKGILYEMLKVH